VVNFTLSGKSLVSYWTAGWMAGQRSLDAMQVCWSLIKPHSLLFAYLATEQASVWLQDKEIQG
jgi:hypothetical protein